MNVYIEWRDYQRANRKARKEYAAHPFSACLGMRITPSGDIPCPNNRHPRDDLCNGCRKSAALTRALNDNDAAALRMRALREKEKD